MCKMRITQHEENRGARAEGRTGSGGGGEDGEGNTGERKRVRGSEKRDGGHGQISIFFSCQA